MRAERCSRAGVVRPRPLYLVCGRRIGRVGATDRLRPWSIKIEKTAKKSKGRRAPFVERSPNSCLGLFVKHEGSPYPQGRANRKGRRKLLDPTPTAKTYAGVDVSKDRLDVCVWRGEAGRHDDDTFFVPNDNSGIDALVSRLVEERPVLVILEATGGFERAVVAALATEGLPVAVGSILARPATSPGLRVGSLRPTH